MSRSKPAIASCSDRIVCTASGDAVPAARDSRHAHVIATACTVLEPGDHTAP
jgi:hypothetical protein